ncbi:MAG TPA: hypothetical protein VFJ16_30455 [Longimicrobium sp.]|nr:hypothetical protein [Longimicrobium sp.]
MWTLRIAVFVVLVDGLGLLTLVTARFYRWKHMKRLVLAGLPRVRKLGGEIAGAGATVELGQSPAEVQIAALERRVEDLHRRVDDLMNGRSNGEESDHGEAGA